MGILPILTILYALSAMGMATDAVAETPAPAGTPELSQEQDATLADALAKSDSVADADSPEENQEQDVTALDGDDEAAETDTPVVSGFEVTEDVAEADTPVVSGFEVTEDVAEADTPAPADQEVMADAAADDTPDDSKAPIVKRVVGGSVSSWSLWRYQVSIQYKSGSRYYHLCGGILIKRNWVLTAARCVEGRRIYRVVAGERDFSKHNCREQYLNVRYIYKHPSWRRNIYAGYDIALVRLSTYATLNNYVRLAVLAPANQVLSSGGCYVSGWGRTSTRSSISNALRHAYTPIVSYSTCRNRYWWGSAVKSSMVCAGGNGRQGACYGDLGGPLSCYRNRRWEVHGIASFFYTRSCNTYRKPTVFTRVSAYRYWINRSVGC